eukprot:7120824-Prymnesium_polylepis.1
MVSPAGRSGMPSWPGYDCSDASPLQAQRAEHLPRFWVMPLMWGGEGGAMAAGPHGRSAVTH